MQKIASKDLQKLYIAFFCRPGDPSGMNYWLSHSSKSLTLHQISYELSLQDEYISHAALDKSIEAQISQIYLNLFSRKVDFDSLNFWLSEIKKKKYLISDIVYYLLWDTDQFISEVQILNKDIQILENKIYAAELFTQKISENITYINLYQPQSLSPWTSGKSFLKASVLMKNVILETISIKEINSLINSFSESKIEILTQPAIQIKNVNLSIPVYAQENRSLTQSFTKKIVNMTGGDLRKSKLGTSILALNNINLKIMKGERVALIGHNGSGKSSFLRLISGIYTPTNGSITVSVDVYPMLQKTFLTSNELTGLDACKAHFLLNNYNLIGFDDFLKDIINFSGLGSFMSLPIKTYSEGMCSRLIFSILTSSPHDCLAIDEGFGTGDANFFEKAEERMKNFMNSAATLFLASHSEELLKQFCNRGIVFSHGSIVYDGSLEAALNYYHTHDYSQIDVIK
tara:strand:+ start:29401 stop:30774 length:1374 start_codon:yes stop_codon:yes gene_type:complete